jgi:Tfp pilus assembly pilus retraction ATPase PilT
MINTKLILVDGITGSGKSTTAHLYSQADDKELLY